MKNLIVKYTATNCGSAQNKTEIRYLFYPEIKPNTNGFKDYRNTRYLIGSTFYLASLENI